MLQKLSDHNLYLKPEKCYFEMDEVNFLGVVTSHNTIQMDPDKVDAVTKWPMPTCKKEVQQFLGFCNYYRRFIEGFAKIAKLLTELTRNSQWTWTPQATMAYQTLKQRLTESLILVLPDNSKPYKVEVDASDFAVGGILSQEQNDGKWKPVAYISHALSLTE